MRLLEGNRYHDWIINLEAISERNTRSKIKEDNRIGFKGIINKWEKTRFIKSEIGKLK